MKSSAVFTEASERLSARPLVVYLDQCVLSRFLENSGDAGWRGVHDLLLRGVEAGRVVCPHSLEHLVETAAMSQDKAIAADAILRRLSAGWSLLVESELVAAQISHRIRRQEVDRAYAFERIRFKPLSDAGAYALLRRTKARLDAFNVHEFALQNELNVLARDNPRGDRATLRLFGRLKNESYTRRFIADLEPSLRDGRAHVVARQGVPDWPSEFSFITGLLIEGHGFGVPELRSLAAQLRRQGVVFVPFYLAKINLEACHLWKGKSRDHGDQYDVTRLSCALPVADVIITDGSAASAIRDVGLDQAFGVQVFSTREAEREGIIAALA
jgi:hypothetical protein